MKHPDENPLLKEILADEPLAALRQASLSQGLDAMRRARQRRRAARMGALALAPLLVVAALVLNKSFSPTPGTPPAGVAGAAPGEFGVKTISDEELFALFPGRSLALVGKPGQQRLVVLDAGAN